MNSLLLALSIFLADGKVDIELNLPRWTDEDTRKLQNLREEALRMYMEKKQRKKLIGKPGCPFEPGTYWNLDCA